MGFWHRLLNRDPDTSDAAAVKLRTATDMPTPVDDLVEDPRERARALHSALGLVAQFDFISHREITVDDVPFDQLGGIDAFNTERLTTLLNLRDGDTALFPRVLAFEYDFVNSNDAYSDVVREVAEAAGTTDQLANVHCDLHHGPEFNLHPLGELRYTVNGTRYSYDVSSEGNWADPAVVAAIFTDLTPAGLVCLSTEGSAFNYWVPADQAERFRTLLTAEEHAGRRRKQRWREEHPGR